MSAVPSVVVGTGSLADRVILIAGAGGGFGSAAAVACAQAGATVVLLGRKPRRLDRVYAAVEAAGPEPLLYPLDLEGPPLTTTPPWPSACTPSSAISMVFSIAQLISPG